MMMSRFKVLPSNVDQHTTYLGGSHFLHLDQQVQECRAHHLGFVVQTVFEGDHDFFQHGVAEGVVQDNCQTLGKTSDK